MTSSVQPSSYRLGFGNISDLSDPTKSQAGLYSISRTATHFPSFLFSDLLLTLYHIKSTEQFGTIRFHKSIPEIELEVNDRKTVLAPSNIHKTRWILRPTVPSPKAEEWLWRPALAGEGAETHSAVLIKNSTDTDKKIFARVTGDVLGFESKGLSDEMRHDVVVSALALCEFARKQHCGFRSLGSFLHARDPHARALPLAKYSNGGVNRGAPSGVRVSNYQSADSPALRAARARHAVPPRGSKGTRSGGPKAAAAAAGGGFFGGGFFGGGGGGCGSGGGGGGGC